MKKRKEAIPQQWAYAFLRRLEAEAEAMAGYVSQDPADRLIDNLEEEAKQNRFAAELWKSHALSGKEEAMLLNGLRATVLNALAYVLDSHPERAAEVAKDLREMAENMERK